MHSVTQVNDLPHRPCYGYGKCTRVCITYDCISTGRFIYTNQLAFYRRPWQLLGGSLCAFRRIPDSTPNYIIETFLCPRMSITKNKHFTDFSLEYQLATMVETIWWPCILRSWAELNYMTLMLSSAGYLLWICIQTTKCVPRLTRRHSCIDKRITIPAAFGTFHLCRIVPNESIVSETNWTQICR